MKEFYEEIGILLPCCKVNQIITKKPSLRESCEEGSEGVECIYSILRFELKIVVCFSENNLLTLPLLTNSKTSIMISPVITSILPKIREYFKSQPVKKAWLFGSFARNEESPTSDIDILVDYDETHGVVSLFQMGGMLMDLSRIAGRKVDLVEINGIMDFAKASIDRDKILIYERKN